MTKSSNRLCNEPGVLIGNSYQIGIDLNFGYMLHTTETYTINLFYRVSVLLVKDGRQLLHDAVSLVSERLSLWVVI
jgi:hypothetical protein